MANRITLEGEGRLFRETLDHKYENKPGQGGTEFATKTLPEVGASKRGHEEKRVTEDLANSFIINSLTSCLGAFVARPVYS
jgi:hypothetical protein